MVEDLTNKNDNQILKSKPNDDLPAFQDIFELWRDPPMEEDPVIVPDIAEIVTQQSLPSVLNDLFYAEIRTADMTNLGNILLGYNSDSTQDDSVMRRLSLAHEKLSYMPKIVCDEFGQHIKILDITNNKLKNLEFLEHFPELTTLIADRNPINSVETNIPWLPKLELLYLNHCKIDQLYWVETLRYNCPNLKFLSLMGNPVVPSFMTRANMYQYLQYRLYVISVMPNLIHLDDKRVTVDERMQAKNMYPTQFVQNLFKTTRARFPYYFRRLTGRMNDYFSITSSSNKRVNQRNVVI